MKAYCVLEPPWHGGEIADHAERFVFVRDAFSITAFLFAPLWMLLHRMWLVFIAYACGVSALEFGLKALGASVAIRTLIWFLLHFLVGFEAPSLQRATLVGRGWRDHGVVVADDIEGAERRFFQSWAPRAH